MNFVLNQIFIEKRIDKSSRCLEYREIVFEFRILFGRDPNDILVLHIIGLKSPLHRVKIFLSFRRYPLLVWFTTYRVNSTLDSKSSHEGQRCLTMFIKLFSIKDPFCLFIKFFFSKNTWASEIEDHQIKINWDKEHLISEKWKTVVNPSSLFRPLPSSQLIDPRQLKIKSLGPHSLIYLLIEWNWISLHQSQLPWTSYLTNPCTVISFSFGHS